MASKKSKVLAIAFCAAVMAGIHVNPVLAAEKAVINGSVTVGYKDFETTTGYEEDSQVTITNIASQDEVKQAQQTAEDAATLAGDALSTAKGVKEDLAQETADREKKDAEHDSAIKNETLDREAADNKIKADLQADINAKEEQSKGRDSQLQANIDAEAEKRKNEDDKLQADINAKEEQSKDRDSQLQANIDAEAEAREKADADLQDQIDGHTNQISSIGKELNDLKESDEAQNGRLDSVEAVNKDQNGRLDGHDVSIKNHEAVMGVTDKTGLESAYEGATYIDKNDTMVEADRKLDAAISDVNSRVDGLENRVDGLEDRIDKVGAMSAAIANLRTMGYDPAAPTEVAVGVGQYRDETGMALGLFHYPNRDFMLSLSVSTSGDEYMGGIGATWKFGRKSPEKVAEIKKAQAEADARRAEEQKLAKAEEMKKAAKEAKVQAQMERHAKLAAERAALEEA